MSAALTARAASLADELEAEARAGPRASLARFARQSPLGVAAGLFILLVLVVGALAPLIAPYDPLANSFAEVRQPPSAQHWLGTDHLGRDTLSRIVHGTRVTMLVAVSSVLIGEALGFAWGVATGYIGGRFDLISQRIIEVLM